MTQPNTLALVLAPLCLLTACSSEGQKLEQSKLEDFARFGSSVDISGTTAVIGAAREPGDTGAARGAAYVFTQSGESWSVQARLTSPAASAEELGRAVSVSGDTLVVGAPLHDQPGAPGSGSVYVFERSGTTWTSSATLASSVPEAAEAFGASVSLDGDWLAVGAADRDQGTAIDAGAVFVYERSGGTWSLRQTLAGPSPASADGLGTGLKLAGSTLVVAAPRRDVAGSADAGSVYVYSRSGSTFSLAQTLTASDLAAGDGFGTSVALLETSAASRRIAVGAAGADLPGASAAGAAYVFDSAGPAPFAQTQKLVASDAAADAHLGETIALSGNRLLVGAPTATVASSMSGAAYVFDAQLFGFVQSDKLALATSHPTASFGSALALAGDFALIAAQGEALEPGGSEHGAVHAFEKPALGAWTHQHSLNAFTLEPSQDFGGRFVLAGDRLCVAGNARVDVLVREEHGFSHEQALAAETDTRILDTASDGSSIAFVGRRAVIGSSAPLAYVDVYTHPADRWQLQQHLEPDLSSVAGGDESGNSLRVAIQGDTLVIGARRWNSGDGRVFVYKRAGAVWTLAQLFTSPRAATDFDLNFGNHVRLSGNTLIVAEVPSSGLPTSPQSGNLYVFTRSSASSDFVQTQVLTDVAPAVGDHFGSGVAIDGDLLAAYCGNTQMLRVFRRRAGTFTQIFEQMLPDVNGINAFDIGLAMAGDRIVIGAPGTTFDGLAGAGEALVLARQLDDSYAAQAVFRAADASASQGLGRTVAIDGTHVVAATNAAAGSVYAFPL